MAKVGRPSKYDPKYCDEIVDYFSKSFDVNDLMTLPLLCDFAISIGVHKDTLNEWKDVHPDFSVALKKAKTIQEACLTRLGLSGKANPSFSIFAMKNICHWRDKQEIEHSGEVGINIISYAEAESE